MAHNTLHSGARARRGFTLTEMIIATTMLGLFGASAITFYLRSLRSVSNTAGRNDAQQNASFALDFMDHDLRIAGTGLAQSQPLFIAATNTSLGFNADLITHDTSASAPGTYFDPSVPDSVALAWQQSSAQNLKNSSFAYPESTFHQSPGVISAAETVQFWLTVDPTPGAPANRYYMMRQVNGNVPSILAKNIYYNPATSTPLFQYYYVDSTNALHQFPTARIATGFFHNSTPQTTLDSIREVRITLTGWFTDPHNGQNVYRTVNEQIRMPNTYMSRIAQCNSPPSPVTSFSATPSTGGQDTVGLSWAPSADDQAGKKTVRMYLIYRKKHTDTTYVQLNSVTPQVPLPGTYSYDDTQSGGGLVLSTPYDYEVVARDCTPALSSAVLATNVTPH